jgi:hypothetical protein
MANAMKTIDQWLSDLTNSTLSPVMSAQSMQAEYERMKAAAYAPTATTADVTAFLNEAKDYLTFARTYSGDYAGIYSSVTGDVQGLADAIAIALAKATTTLPMHAGGGLTSGPTISGELGREWNVPTYEPQRSRFLENAPPQFWANLRMGGSAQGGGDVTVRVPVYLDGKVIADVVAKHVPRNDNLNRAIQGVKRMN